MNDETGSQEEPQNRDGTGRFLPGNNANPGGRPKDVSEFRALLRQGIRDRLPAIWERIDAELADPETSGAITKLVLEQGFGKATQAFEVDENLTTMVSTALGRAHEAGFEALRQAALARAAKAKEEA